MRNVDDISTTKIDYKPRNLEMQITFPVQYK